LTASAAAAIPAARRVATLRPIPPFDPGREPPRLERPDDGGGTVVVPLEADPPRAVERQRVVDPGETPPRGPGAGGRDVGLGRPAGQSLDERVRPAVELAGAVGDERRDRHARVRKQAVQPQPAGGVVRAAVDVGDELEDVRTARAVERVRLVEVAVGQAFDPVGGGAEFPPGDRGDRTVVGRPRVVEHRPPLAARIASALPERVHGSRTDRSRGQRPASHPSRSRTVPPLRPSHSTR
jgi:hypothetical protein